MGASIGNCRRRRRKTKKANKISKDKSDAKANEKESH
jgi:hypothetical protein